MDDAKKSESLDKSLVEALVGKTMLVGMTYLDPDGEVLEQKQFFGVIENITKEEISLRHPKTNERYSLPPDFSSCKKAEPGEYQLKSTGEVVVNPDLTALWTVTKKSQ